MNCPYCNWILEEGYVECTDLFRPNNMYYSPNKNKEIKGFINKLKAKTYLFNIGLGTEAKAYRCEQCGKIFAIFDYEK